MLDELQIPAKIVEDLAVRRELNPSSIGRLGILPLLLRVELPPLEAGSPEAAFAVTDHLESVREGVHRLAPDAVQPYGELEDIVVVLAPGIDLADALDQLAQRDAPPVVADAEGVLIQGDLDALALAHDELVDGVVDDLLEHDVDAIQGMGPVAEAPDVHPAAKADVLQGIQGLNRGFVVRDLLLRHSALSGPGCHGAGSSRIRSVSQAGGRRPVPLVAGLWSRPVPALDQNLRADKVRRLGDGRPEGSRRSRQDFSAA